MPHIYDSDKKVIAAEDDHPLLLKMLDIQSYLTKDRIQECWNDMKYYRDEARALFRRNQINLAMTARIEQAYLYMMNHIKALLKASDTPPKMSSRHCFQLADIYHCNFSLFQSLPDIWAIDQIHPIAPLQRLDEPAERYAILKRYYL